MSRIGKKYIDIKPGVEVLVEDKKVSIKGKLGTLLFEAHPDIEVTKEDSRLVVLPAGGKENLEKPTRALWGMTRQILFNMVQGVTEGYEKKLEIEGVGYRAVLEGDSLVLHIGFTNPVKLKIPEGIKVVVEKNVLAIAGLEKQKVGQFAASVRKTRVVEPYKGKGIKYQGEQVRRKLGKRAAATTGAGAGAK